MLGDVVRVVNCAAKPQLLQLTVQQLLGATNQMSQHNDSALFVLSRALSDHCCTSYITGLQTAAKSMVPVLFMGGQASIISLFLSSGSLQMVGKAATAVLVHLYCTSAFISVLFVRFPSSGYTVCYSIRNSSSAPDSICTSTGLTLSFTAVLVSCRQTMLFLYTLEAAG